MNVIQRHQRSFACLAACLAALAIFQLMSRFDNKYTMRAVTAQDETAEISSRALLENQLVWLPDGWELFPDQTDLPEETAHGIPTFIGQYPTLSPFHRDGSPYGAAAYRLRISWDGEPAVVSLWLQEVFSACSIWVNGKLVETSGALQPYEPQVRNLTVSFLLVGETELVIQTANFSHYYSGMTYPPALGTPEAVSSLIAQRTAIYSFLSVSALTVALFSVALWLGWRRERTALWLAGLTLSFALRVSYPLRLIGGVSQVSLAYAVEDTAAMAGIWCALHLALELRSRAQHRWTQAVVHLAVGMAVIGAVIPVAVLPKLGAFTPFYSVFISLWKLLAALLLIGIFLTGRSDADAVWLAAGGGVYATSLALSITSINQYEPIRGCWPDEYGSFALVLCFAAVMVHRNLEVVRENHHLNKHLQDEVARQTAQISGLVNERQMLLSEFLHDLKSPLSSILAYARLVHEHNILLDKTTQTQLGVIEEKSQELAQQLTAMQQLTTQNAVLSPHVLVDLAAMLREFHRKNQPDVEANGPDFLLSVPKYPCLVEANQEQLNRAVQNLVYNALGFTPENGVITLSLRCEGDEAVITVQDNGCGIDPAIRDRIFERSFTTRPDDGGMGLGLYIVRSVAQEHGGSVSVDSVPGQGAAFHIRLPLAQPEQG